MKKYSIIFLLLLCIFTSCDKALLSEEEDLLSLSVNLLPPEQLDDDIPTASLSALQLDTIPLQHMVETIYNEQPNSGIRSILIAKHDTLVLESYFNGWNRNRKQDIRSATKSFTAMLMGIAIDKNMISDVNQPVYSYFTNYESFQNWEERKSLITIEDLLRMRTGLECNDWDFRSVGNEERMYTTDDWIKFVLDLPMIEDPGAQFSYCTGAPVTLGAIIANSSGKPIPEFSKDYLFAPLGISDYTWEFMPNGRADTGGHLHLRSRDMLKFGLLILNKGRWKKQQLIAEAWVEKALEPKGIARDITYGYLWWSTTFTVNDTEIPAFFASGNGGQRIYIIPSLDAVVVFTGGNYNRSLARLNTLLETQILPALTK